VFVVELVFDVTKDTAGLSDAAFAEQDHLEVVAPLRRSHLDNNNEKPVSHFSSASSRNSYFPQLSFYLITIRSRIE
jgi:hypothetical protein